MESQVRLWLEPLATAAGDGADGVEAAEILSDQEQAWAAGLAAPRRQAYATSRRLLRRRLAAVLACAAEAVPLHSPPGARPLLPEGAGWVSLSHSGGALLVGWSPRPIGVDLEWAARPLAAAALIARYFPSEERQRLQLLPAARQREVALRSWTVKEAAIKWRGRTLAAELRHWGWDERCGRLRHAETALEPPVAIRNQGGWLCAAVGDGVGAARWSDGLKNCRN